MDTECIQSAMADVGEFANQHHWFNGAASEFVFDFFINVFDVCFHLPVLAIPDSGTQSSVLLNFSSQKTRD